MTMKPSRKAIYASMFLVIAVLGLCTTSFVRDLTSGAFAHGEKASLAIFVFGLTFCLPIAIQAWRWSRLEVSDYGVRWLRWSGPSARRWYPRFEPTALAWSEVRVAKVSGGTFKLESERHRVTIEVLLFEEPKAAIAFVTSRLARAGIVLAH